MIALLIILVDRYLLTRELATISYSEFKVLLKDGLVDDLVVSSSTIEGDLLPGAPDRLLSIRNEKDTAKIKQLKGVKEFLTVRIQDPDLVKEMTEKASATRRNRTRPGWATCCYGSFPFSSSWHSGDTCSGG